MFLIYSEEVNIFNLYFVSYTKLYTDNIFYYFTGQLINYKFPCKIYSAGKKEEKRTFKLKWMDEYEWLLYSKSNDAAFCRYCTKFATKYKHDQFVTSGFSNWKTAMNSDGGFKKHQTSANHIEAVFKSKEHDKATQAEQDIHSLLAPNVLADRRYYFCKLINVVRFIAKNGLPFRGLEYDALLSKHIETGLCYNFFYSIYNSLYL